MLEELEAKEHLTYNFKVPSGNFSWIFKVTPTQNATDFYINGDKKPENYMDY